MEYDAKAQVFVIENDKGQEIEVPARMAVCERCQGSGSHSNPSIDSHGITQEEWDGPDWDDESRETYMSGGYDVSCEECKGSNVIPVPDTQRMTPEQRKLVEDWQESEAEYQAICAMERRVGA